LIIVTPRNSLKFVLNTSTRKINYSNSHCLACLEKMGSIFALFGISSKRSVRLEEKDQKDDDVMLVENRDNGGEKNLKDDLED
jgi:hypothetical protein